MKPVPLMRGDGTFTDIGFAVDDQLKEVIFPIVRQLVKNGYDPVHVEHAIHRAASWLTTWSKLQEY